MLSILFDIMISKTIKTYAKCYFIMFIRLADLDDAENIAENNVLLAYESENLDISFETTLDGVKGVLSDPGKGFYLIVEEDDTIIGQLMITFEWSDWKNKTIWWLQSVYVKENYRVKGIFKHLVKEIKNMASENNVDIVRLYVHNDNVKAVKIYRRMGMKKKPYTIYQLSLSP
jgi:ribosomal protein S18 acetylase RimI-like enzyme